MLYQVYDIKDCAYLSGDVGEEGSSSSWMLDYNNWVDAELE